MANYLVRWWKTRFFNGYKQFTGVDDDCEDDRCENPAGTNLKELSCDVSLKESSTVTCKDRLQEFSFTLYDFDGHGKVTKDDIAGLVTTIYETLGSSLKVPHYGSKTIKVKLTVSPNLEISEDSCTTETVLQSCNNQINNINNNNVNLNNNNNLNYNNSNSISNIHNSSNNHNNINNNSNFNNNSHSIHNSNSKGYKKDFIETIKEKKTGKVIEDPTRHSMPQFSPMLNCNSCRSKKRSSSLQRQQLLKIIQANMEKNNLPFQTSRSSPIWVHEKEKISRCHPWKGVQESIGRHHHQKHRHREAEQARAMAQVVRWLEQEFSSPKQDKYNQFTPTNECLEHRHVHEHVHHHYHHYQDAPVSI